MVAGGNVAPGGVSVRRHAVGDAFLFDISLCYRSAQCVLRTKQHHKNTSLDSRQTRVNRNIQHNGIEKISPKTALNQPPVNTQLQKRFRTFH